MVTSKSSDVATQVGGQCDQVIADCLLIGVQLFAAFHAALHTLPKLIS